jgi:Cdc6-like AAA superfamily ATPase
VLANITYVVLEGSRDSGKTVVAKWLRKQVCSVDV